MEITEILLILVAGFAAGFINTVAGGGSLLTLPVLIFMGLPPSMANGTNRVAIFVQNIFAVRGFQSKGVSAWPYSGWLGLSALCGAVLGAKIAVDIRGDTFNKILGIVMVIAILFTVFKPAAKKEQVAERMEPKHRFLGILLFFFVGIYGGFIQAGVGFLIITVLTSVNGFNLVKTNAAKVMVVLIYTVAALAVFIYEDQINWTLGGVLAIGNSTGAWIASRWSVGAGEKWIRGFLVVTVMVMAVKLWFS